jgi:hypothetical protein
LQSALAYDASDKKTLIFKILTFMPVNKSKAWLALLSAGWAMSAQAEVITLDGKVNQIFVLDVGPNITEAFSRGTALNDRGDVAGYFRPSSSTSAPWVGLSGSPSSGFDYGVVDKVTPSSSYDRVFTWGINAQAGTPVLVGGARRTGDTPLFAFYGVKNSSGQYDLRSIGGYQSQPQRYSEAKGINNAGVAVGYVCSDNRDCLNTGSGTPSAFRYDGQTGQLTEGFAGMNAVASQARAINKAGMIAGAYTPSGGNSHALRYDSASQSGTDLHQYLTARTDARLLSSTATAINDAADRTGKKVGDVAGTATYTLSSGDQQNEAFLLRAGQAQAIRLRPAPTTAANGSPLYEGTAAAAIDPFGWVVGTACAKGAGCGSFNENGSTARPVDNTAMLWVDRSGLDLSTINGLAAQGWTKLSFADAVTRVRYTTVVDGVQKLVDAELITGVGYYGDVRRAFLLRLDASAFAVPEPATWLLFAVGLVALAGRRLHGLAA